MADRHAVVVGVEVKASSSVQSKDFRGLEALRETVGRQFHRGVLLYTGQETLPFGPRLHAVPMSALWRLGAQPLDTRAV